MKVTNTNFTSLKVIETDIHGDNRGWFTEVQTGCL